MSAAFEMPTWASMPDRGQRSAPIVTMADVQGAVCEAFGIDHRKLVGPQRHRVYAQPRHVAMFLTRLLTQESLPAIGRAFGGRDHSTVISAVWKIAKLRREDSEFAVLVDAVKEKAVDFARARTDLRMGPR